MTAQINKLLVTVFHSLRVMCKNSIPAIATSVPFIEIVFSSILIPFSGVIIIFPECNGIADIYVKVILGLSYSVVYALQLYNFRYLLLALSKKKSSQLTTWMKMKILFLALQGIIAATLFVISPGEKSFLPHKITVLVFVVFSIFSMLVVGIHKRDLGTSVDNSNIGNTQMERFNNPPTTCMKAEENITFL